MSVYLAGAAQGKAASVSELSWRKMVLLRHFGTPEGRELVREHCMFDPERWLGRRPGRAGSVGGGASSRGGGSGVGGGVR